MYVYLSFPRSLTRYERDGLKGSLTFCQNFLNLHRYVGKQAALLSLFQVNHFSTFLICCVFLRVGSGGMGDDLLAQHSDIHSVHMLFNLIVLTSTPLILMGQVLFLVILLLWFCAQSVSQCDGVLILQLDSWSDTLPDASQTPRAVLWSQFLLQSVMCSPSSL